MRSIHKPILLAGAVSSLLFLTSCAFFDWMQGKTSNEEVTELESGMTAPEKRTTPFDEALRSLGSMLTAYDIPQTAVQSKNIGNQTAEKVLPSDLYVMISTALNKIGKQVLFIPYDAKYIISESTTGGQINRIYPDIVITGGITGFDKEMIEKERKGEIEGGWAGASGAARYDVATGVSQIALDLNLLDYTTQSSFPGVLSTNAILLRKDKLGWGVSAYYMGCGGSFDSKVKTQQGVYVALRMLVEYSLLEVLGKYFNVPYWKCIKGANPDSEMIARMIDNYREMTPDQQIPILKKYLFIHGHKWIDRKSNTLNASEQQALSKAMRQYGVSTNTELMVKMWEDVNVNTAKDIVIQDRRKRAVEFQRASAEQEKQAQFAAQQEAERKVREAAELKELQAKYDSFIAAGDNYVKENNYEKALEGYDNALKIGPDMKYPNEQAAKLRAFLEKRKAAAETYTAAVAAGDGFFKAKEYEKAKAEYNKAAVLKTDDESLTKKLEDLNRLLSHKQPAGVGKINEKDFNDE
jgi:tetratricopeptide (TPR) repeat protein